MRSVQRKGDWRFEIQTALPLQNKAIGASIACAGCCLTLVEKGTDWFAVDVSAESLSKTTLKTWEEGTQVNLEPALRAGDELGGHIVSGHVDGLAEIVDIIPAQDSHLIRLRVPGEHAALIAPKGSVTLDGVSLTVNTVDANMFTVNIIPHTWQVTTLGQLKTGSMLNFEVDMLARYIMRQREVLK